jgi:uncharacterized repeat protein (TIGR02543 family)
LVTNKKISKVFFGPQLIYSLGNIVNYVVDTNTSYNIEVEEGENILNPTMFTPSKDGWTFVGWREDKTASNQVLSSKVMGEESITLYAVFSKIVTQTFISYNKTDTVNGTAYYNNGNIEGAKITYPSGNAYPGWTWRGWSSHNSTVANAAVEFDSGYVLGVGTTNYTVYGLYQQSVKLSYYISGVARSITDTMYYNAAGTSLYPTVRVSNPSLSGATFKGWSVIAGNATVSYSSLASGIQLSSNLTVYAVFQYAAPAAETQSHQHDADDDAVYGETHDDTPRYCTLTMPATAGSMTVTAYGYSGASECIYLNNYSIELKEDGVWRNVGTFTTATTVSIIYGYAIWGSVTFKKTYTGKTVVG